MTRVELGCSWQKMLYWLAALEHRFVNGLEESVEMESKVDFSSLLVLKNWVLLLSKELSKRPTPILKV
jgi:hypothetical protein